MAAPNLTPQPHSLLFNVSQLLKDDVGDSRQYAFAAGRPMNLDGAIAEDVHGTVRFMLTNFGIVATGQADARLRLTCARCLEEFNAPAHITFEEEYRPSIDIATGLPARLPESDSAFTISANHTIDLAEALRQDLLVAVEMVPVCQQDCRGLCPTCGVNRNVEACDCPPEEAESPFAALSSLLAATGPEGPEEE